MVTGDPDGEPSGVSGTSSSDESHDEDDDDDDDEEDWTKMFRETELFGNLEDDAEDIEALSARLRSAVDLNGDDVSDLGVKGSGPSGDCV